MSAHGTARLVHAAAPVDGAVAVPGSKSLANRALVCAALAHGESVLNNVPDGDDVTAMIASLRTLGVGVSRENSGPVVVTGAGAEGLRAGPNGGPVHIDAMLAGTTARFLTAVAALGDRHVVIDGGPPLRQRPFAPLFEALADLGARVESLAEPGYLPVRVTGPITNQAVAIRGDVSSQFITALMLIGACLHDGLRIGLTTELVSRPYVELTAGVMQHFGAGPCAISDAQIAVPATGYVPQRFEVEPDASSASYPMALAAIVGGRVEVPGLGSNSAQGDQRFVDILAQMGCQVSVHGSSTTVSRDLGSPLHGVDLDLSDMSDLVPTVAAVAAVASTPTQIRGVGFIRNKESDRLGDLLHEFRKLGVDGDETDDGLTIRPSEQMLRAASIDPHHDHRLAMAGAILGSRIGEVRIEDPDVVSKSWPGFWTMLDRITS